MKFCSKCGSQIEDGTKFCPVCGAPADGSAPYAADSTDHTAEFDPADISDNKVIAMLPYLMGVIGIFVALLAINNSKYVSFNLKQELKLEVCSILSLFLLIIPILGWIAAGVCGIIIFVLKIIGFFNVCKGRAKELPIVSSLGFLK